VTPPAVVVATGTRGDVEPLLAIAAGLRRGGRQVYFLTNSGHVSLAARAGVDARPLDDEAAFRRFLDDQPLLNDLRTATAFHARHVVPAWQGRLEAVREACGGPGAVVVALALDSVPARCAAEADGARLVTVCISPMQALGAPYLADFYASRLAGDINGLRRRAGLPEVADWRRWLASPRAGVGNWPAWFAPDVRGPCTPVGFLLDDPDAAGAAPAGLDDRPVLVTGGTGNFTDAAFYEAAVGGCGLLGRPALVVTRRRELVPAALPPGVRWAPEVAHAAIMSGLSAVIHHGGINTTARALRAGVPQLVLPAGHDRPDNAERVERLGAGRLVRRPRWSAATVAEGLRALAAPAVMAACDASRRRLACEGDAAARAAAIIEAAA
jgi:rhamnosyltransferase subunit B